MRMEGDSMDFDGNANMLQLDHDTHTMRLEEGALDPPPA
jgi:hypothetical protein